MYKVLRRFFILSATLIFIFFLNIININISYAEGEFASDANILYEFEEDGSTKVISDIRLENLQSNIYAKGYSMIMDNLEPKNIKVTQDGQILNTKSTKEGTKTQIDIEFDDPVLGKNNFRNFQIEYQVEGLLEKTGDVWEINIPKLENADSYRNYQITLSVPNSFGNKAYMSPDPVNVGYKGDRAYYSFSKASIAQTSISAGFGSFQVFSYDLSYHLENPLNKTAVTKIAIPPDTAFQKIYLDSIDPKPQNIETDEDGNWLATYVMKSRQRFDVKVVGQVQMFSTERNFPKPSQEILLKNSIPQKYWESSDTGILLKAKELKDIKDVYDFVVGYLTYDYTRVKSNVERLGAKTAFENPQSAICMEFTDLFIALARAKGIPAREVNGFAYTENVEIQPLSLVADVLHSWPEYWDDKRGVWFPVDPTWQNTTGGIDFFRKLDLRHFNFVMHGVDSQKPYPPGSYKLGANPQKDVFVNFSKLTEDREENLEIEAKQLDIVPIFYKKLKVKLINNGKSALYNVKLGVNYEGLILDERDLESILPYQTYEYELKLPFDLFGKNNGDRITITAKNSAKEIKSTRTRDLLYVLTAVMIVIFMIFLIILAGFKNFSIKNLISKNNKNDKNIKEKSKENIQN